MSNDIPTTVALNTGFYGQPFNAPLTLADVNVNFFDTTALVVGGFSAPILSATVPNATLTPEADRDSFGLTLIPGGDPLGQVLATFTSPDFPAPLAIFDTINPTLVAAWVEDAADDRITQLTLSSNISDRPYAIIVDFGANGPTVREVVEEWTEADLRALNPTINEGVPDNPWDWTGTNGDDILKGGKDNDGLFGGGGRDRLFDDKGNDVLEGGGDDDLFVFSRQKGGGNDSVFMNLSDDDVLRLTGWGMTPDQDIDPSRIGAAIIANGHDISFDNDRTFTLDMANGREIRVVFGNAVSNADLLFDHIDFG